ncbi:MAG: hypothetical protein AAFY71_07190 [Bacteroidota bacterium]
MKYSQQIQIISILLSGIFLLLLTNCQGTVEEEETQEEQPAPEAIQEVEFNLPEFIQYEELIQTKGELVLDRLEYYQDIRDNESKTRQEAGKLEYTDIYPLGWSKSGNFAFAEHGMTYQGAHEITYRILDTNRNDTLFDKTFIYAFVEDTTDDTYLDMDADEVILFKDKAQLTAPFKTLWRTTQQPLFKVFNQFDITFNPRSTYQAVGDFEGPGFKVIKQTMSEEETAYFLLSKVYPKYLLTRSYFDNEFPSIQGYFVSPNNTHFAVLSRQKRKMFEMTHEIVPYVVGYKRM